MTDRELMQQALDAMLNFPNDISDEMFESIRVLRARLAQPEQKPVAWMYDSQVGFNVPLYTAPPQREWVGLTEAERIDIIDEEITAQSTEHFALAQAIEAKLKEKTMDRQCPSCGGFCKETGCERENVPPKREWQGLTQEQIQQIEMSASSKLSAIYLAEAQLKGKNIGAG